CAIAQCARLALQTDRRQANAFVVVALADRIRAGRQVRARTDDDAVLGAGLRVREGVHGPRQRRAGQRHVKDIVRSHDAHLGSWGRSARPPLRAGRPASGPATPSVAPAIGCVKKAASLAARAEEAFEANAFERSARTVHGRDGCTLTTTHETW